MTFDMLENEYWWGGCVCTAEKMPFDCNTVFTFDLQRDKRTQTAPLFLSSKGRYLWSEDPFIIEFKQLRQYPNTFFSLIFPPLFC